MRNRTLAILTSAAAAAVASSVPAQQPAEARSVAAQLAAMDSAWARSYATHDTALARHVMADDIVITSSNGSMKDLRRELQDVGPYPDLTLHYFRTADVRVREDGNVVIGRLEWEYTLGGRVSREQKRYTAVYARGGPLGWRMVALHVGPAPP
jgi:ketosteroid isomerase-like protein